MKKFIGTKTVEAMPMTLGEFIKKTGRNPYANDGKMHGENEEGYLVRYKDGYESWSPAEPFEEAYRCSETFLDRLVIEHNELSDKQEKLNKFFGSDTFEKLPISKQTLLHAQFGAMLAYSQILAERIRIEQSNCECCKSPFNPADHIQDIGCTCDGSNECQDNTYCDKA